MSRRFPRPAALALAGALSAASALGVPAHGAPDRGAAPLWYGSTRPPVSNLNLLAGETRADGFVQLVATDGQLSLANAFGSTHAIVDVNGVFKP